MSEIVTMIVRYFSYLLMTALFLITGCQPLATPSEKYHGQTPKEIFVSGDVYLAKKHYADAIIAYEALDALYPYNDYAEQAQISLIYAYYESENNPGASAAAERFIRLYPRSSHVDYAYYMKGLSDFYQDRGWFQRYLPMDLSLRDPGTMRESFNDFATLARLMPKSHYSEDARKRMQFLKNTFAQSELNVAEYYYKRGAYVAAANRANEVVKHFDGTPAVMPALKIMSESYAKLDQTESSKRVETLIRLNTKQQ